MDWEVIAPMIVSIVLIVTVGGVALLRPLAKRVADLLELYARDRESGIESDVHQMRDLLETMNAQVCTAVGQLGFSQAGVQAIFNEQCINTIEDIKRLKDKYLFSPKAVGNITGLIFGPEYREWIEKGIAWYKKIKPMLESLPEKEKKEPTTGAGQRSEYTIQGA